MKYYIDYDKLTGRILGFLIDTTKKQGEAIEVSKEQWDSAMAFNKIIVKGDNITFEKVDWRTQEEIEESRVQNINSYTQSFITTKYPLEKQSSANLGIYGDEYKTEMINFISNCITLSNEAIINNINFEDYKAMLDE